MSLLGVQMGDKVGQIIFACLALLALVFVLCVGLWYYRRRVLKSAGTDEPVWTFQDLRDMRDRGEITEEEYQAIRQTMIGAYRGPETEEKPPINPSSIPEIEPESDNFDLEKGPQA